MGRSGKRVLVNAGPPWFAARLAAHLAPAGYAVARVDAATAGLPGLDHSLPAAVVLHLAPRSDHRADLAVAPLRAAGFVGPVVVLNRVRKIAGATHYLLRAASPAQVAAEVRRLVEAAV